MKKVIITIAMLFIFAFSINASAYRIENNERAAMDKHCVGNLSFSLSDGKIDTVEVDAWKMWNKSSWDIETRANYISLIHTTIVGNGTEAYVSYSYSNSASTVTVPLTCTYEFN